MVLDYGMGETLGPMTFPRRRGPGFLDRNPFPEPREYSEETARALDVETKRILEERMARVTALLTAHRHTLERVARVLLEKETIEAEDFARLVAEAEAEAAAARPAEAAR
jgi:cell division protease FtsH